MENDFEEELTKLIKQAYDAGYLYAAWSDGAHVSNDTYNKSEDELRLAIEQFINKNKG